MKPITLSFDNGPYPGVTERVLDVLAARGIRTTFFLVGRQLAEPEGRVLAERAAAEGHWLGNHTMTHSVQLGATDDADAPHTEIGATQDLLGPLSHPDRLFRPYGAGGVLGPDLLSGDAVRFLRDGGYSCVLWSSVPQDWEPSVDWVARCMADAAGQEWPLVVLHDLPGCAIRRLPEFLDRLGEEGYEIRQEFPPAHVPMYRGSVRGSLDGLVRSTEATTS